MKHFQKDTFPKIGEVYLIDFKGRGSEQKGLRPGLVVQNNKGNEYSPNIIVLPLTTNLKKFRQPTHVVIPAKGTGLKMDSMVLCENPYCVSKDYLGKYLTKIPCEYMGKIAAASLLATSVVSFVDPESLLAIWQQSVIFNNKHGGSNYV